MLITDNLKNSDLYNRLNKYFEEIFSHIKNLREDELGGDIIIEEGMADFSTSCVKAAKEGVRMFEAHRKFIDIHFVLRGKETFGYANVDKLTPETEYNDEEDYLFLKGDITEITLEEGDFCIVYPQDAHIPVLRKECSEDLIRGVAKIKI